jgi:hypothetical protein
LVVALVCATEAVFVAFSCLALSSAEATETAARLIARTTIEVVVFITIGGLMTISRMAYVQPVCKSKLSASPAHNANKKGRTLKGSAFVRE